MSEPPAGAAVPRVAYWPFIGVDLLLVATAWLIYHQANRPMVHYEVAAIALCTALGAWLAVWPLVLQHRADLARDERTDLVGTLAQLQQLDQLAERIALATGQWQTAQEHAAGAVNAAREIAERMSAEQKAFQVFIEQAAGTQRQHLELEVNKLRRAEGDWLQTAVRILDHVYALYVAAQRSGQPHLAAQIDAFQNACRDAARRVGLVPLVVTPGTPFDPNVHQPYDPATAVPANALVGDTIGAGYSFQGRLLRRVVVLLQPGAQPEAPLVSGETTTLRTVSGDLPGLESPPLSTRNVEELPPAVAEFPDSPSELDETSPPNPA